MADQRGLPNYATRCCHCVPSALELPRGGLQSMLQRWVRFQ